MQSPNLKLSITALWLSRKIGCTVHCSGQLCPNIKNILGKKEHKSGGIVFTGQNWSLKIPLNREICKKKGHF